MSLLTKIINKIAGEYPAVRINERAARIVCLFTALNYFIGSIAAAFLGLSFQYTIFQFFVSLPFFIMFYFLVKGKYVRKVIIGLVIILSASFVPGWFSAGGVNGPFLAGGLIIFYVLLNIVLVRNRLQVSVLMICLMSLAILLNYLNPHWVVDYPQNSGRYVDYLLMIFQFSAYFILIETSNRYCYNYEQNMVTQRNEELEQANKAKLQLFAIISHDLKGPMATLKGILNSVEEGFSTPEKLQRQLLHLKTMTTPLNNTLDNLLLWSRQQLEGLNAAPEFFTVDEILHEEILLAAEDARTRQVKIDNRIANDTMVYVDINHLRIIFRNLISNAIKHAHKETAIELMAAIKDDGVVFSVSNTGTQISAMAAEVFNRTGKLDGTETRHKQPGLGLQLCHDFIKANGGKIWIDSSALTKTVFCFILPNYNA